MHCVKVIQVKCIHVLTNPNNIQIGLYIHYHTHYNVMDLGQYTYVYTICHILNKKYMYVGSHIQRWGRPPYTEPSLEQFTMHLLTRFKKWLLLTYSWKVKMKFKAFKQINPIPLHSYDPGVLWQYVPSLHSATSSSHSSISTKMTRVQQAYIVYCNKSAGLQSANWSQKSFYKAHIMSTDTFV